MENEKKKEIIYLVVGVAILVITIVGATVAYFATTAGTNTTAITGNTGKGADLQLTVTRVHPASNPGPLVPLDVDPASGDTSQLGDALSHNCIDSATNTVCHIYSIKVKNTSSGVVNVAGTITITSEAPNLKWKFLTNATTDNNDGTFRSPSSTAVNITSSETLQATNGEQTYYVMVWLEETGTDQGVGTTNDANQNFSGTVTFNAVDTSGNAMDGLTAVFGTGATNENVKYAVNDGSNTVFRYQSLPEGINLRSTQEAAMNDWTLSSSDGGWGLNEEKPFFIKYVFGDNVPIEAYVGFVMNGTTYYLQGWVNESNFPEEDRIIYKSNEDTIKTAFDYENYPDRCTYDSSYIYCASGDLEVEAFANGRVNADDVEHYCYVFNDDDTYDGDVYCS